MKQWMAHIVMLLFGAGIAAAVILGVPHVPRPWEPDEEIAVATPAPTNGEQREVEQTAEAEQEKKDDPVFHEDGVLKLTEQTAANWNFPAGARYIDCTVAYFRPANRLWMVSCDYLAERGGRPIETEIYTFDDDTAEVRGG